MDDGSGVDVSSECLRFAGMNAIAVRLCWTELVAMHQMEFDSTFWDLWFDCRCLFFVKK